MPPKKSSKSAAPPPAPTRRSARLASREPSLEPVETVEKGTVKVVKKKRPAKAAPAFSVEDAIEQLSDPRVHQVKFIRSLTDDQRKAVIVGLAEQNGALLEEVSELKEQLTESRGRERPNLRRDLALEKIRAEHAEKEKEKEREAERKAEREREEQKRREREREAEAEVEKGRSAPTTPKASPMTALAVVPLPATAPHAGVLRRVLSTFGGYMASPFSRKRMAVEAADEPSQKRVRVAEEETASPEQQQVEETVVAHPEKRSADDGEEETPRPAKRIRAAETQQTPPSATSLSAVSRQSRSPSPRSAFLGPSAKNNKIPTSLSTITEYTEPSHLTSSDAPDSTPSRPSRAPQSYGVKTSQNTPAVTSRLSQQSSDHKSVAQSTNTKAPASAPPSALSSISSPDFQSTPSHPPIMRRSAMRRAAQMAQRNNTPTARPYSWEKSASATKPKEPNADIRLAKLQEMRDLERRLAQLRQDKDIMEIESHSIHRRKRVKIDDLAVIPHNRPGDSSSTFRVPDIDSDDEMEIDDTTESTKESIFDNTPNAQEQTKKQQPSTAFQQTMESSSNAQATAASTFFKSAAEASRAPATATPSSSQTAPNASATATSNFTPAGQSTKPSLSAQATASSTSQPLSGTNMNNGKVQATSSPFNFPSSTKAPSTATERVQHHEEPMFNFPSVGKRPDDYYYSEDDKQAAGRAFTDGFNAWKSEQGIMT